MISLRDNRSEIVTAAARAFIAPIRLLPELLHPDREGKSALRMGNGGITVGLHVGDLVGSPVSSDHLMPGACVEADPSSPATVGDVHLLSCLGNPVFDAAGRPVGVVVGKRGGLAPGFLAPTHLAVDLFPETESSLAPGDPLTIHVRGRGLALIDYPDIDLFNCSPDLLDVMPFEQRGTRLSVPVRALVEAGWAGAGLGQDPWVGDLEVTDSQQLPTDLRFGDLVAFLDVDARTDRSYRAGHVTIGSVAHGPSARPGHGVGVTVLSSAPRAFLDSRLDDTATGIASGLQHIAQLLVQRHPAVRGQQETT